MQEIKLGEEVINIIKQMHERDPTETERDIIYTLMSLVAIRDKDKNDWNKEDWKKYFQLTRALSYLLRTTVENKIQYEKNKMLYILKEDGLKQNDDKTQEKKKPRKNKAKRKLLL